MAAQRLNHLAAPGDSVAHVEIGYLGYLYNGRTLDPLGLTGDVELHQVSKGNLLWGLMKLEPDFLLLMDDFGFMTGFPDLEPWFPGVYRPVDLLGDPRFPGKQIRIFARQSRGVMPPPLAISIRQTEGEQLLRPVAGAGIGQGFHCTEDGLTRIDLMLGPEDRFPAPGGALFQLFRDGPDGEKLLEMHVPPGRLPGRRRFYPIRFGTALSSAGGDFYFRIIPAGPDEQLPALRASRHDCYAGGGLHLDGVLAEGDLVFRSWYADRQEASSN